MPAGGPGAAGGAGRSASGRTRTETSSSSTFAPGDYVLQASGRGRNGIEFATRFLVVGEDDIGGLSMRTTTGSVVSRRASRWRATAREHCRATFSSTSSRRMEDVSPDPACTARRLGDDWSFEYDGLFGALLVRPGGRPEWLLRSVRVNGVDVTDTPLSFGRRADSLTDVEVILTSQGAEITGSAIDPRGQTGLTYTVVSVPRLIASGGGAIRASSRPCALIRTARSPCAACLRATTSSPLSIVCR